QAKVKAVQNVDAIAHAKFEDPEHPDKVYKVVKALYGLHQDPRAWYETLATYLLENGFQKGTIDQTLFIKKQQKDILLVQVYVDDIIFGATNKALCQLFEKLMKDKFQMSSMGELTFFLKLQKEEESHVQAKDLQAKDAQAKGIQYIRRYHEYKKKPQSESKACKNMIAYLKNTEGFKMAFFKGKTYDQIRLIFQARFDANMRFLLKSKEEMEKEEKEIIKSTNETPAQKAAKRRRLPTPIGRKVPIVNYEIVMINNKPRYKIFRADDTHQLYTSFITLLKNFDREDLEDLWKIVKATFSTSKPTNFTDDYLLVTLKNMFEKTDAQDVIWRSQQTEHGQALLLELMLLKRPKENTKCVNAAGEELTAAKHMLELKLFRDDAAAAHMKVENDEVIFDVDQSMKKPPSKDDECYSIDELDDTIHNETQELLEKDQSDLFLLKPRKMTIFHDMVEDFMEVFMDDFLVFGNSFDNCLVNLDKMLARCKETNLALNWEKCHFMVMEGIILGHKISGSRIKVDKAKIDVIAKFPYPTNVKDVRSFLGHAGFYRRFIKDLSMDDPYAFRLCVDNIMRRCVAGSEVLEILAHCHSGPTGGHHSSSITGRKVYEAEFFWPSIFKDAKDYITRCDACQRSGNISSRSEMPQNNIQMLDMAYPISMDMAY
nr:reverse transcriptase domain-containing protein [Tanacetum cinerariifolium]